MDADEPGRFWVTRAKDNLRMKVKQRLSAHADPRILRDDLVVLQVYMGSRPRKIIPNWCGA